MRPPLMSVVAASEPCGPPPSTVLRSWYGRRHGPFGSGTHGANVPSGLRGMPSAPGKVPK